ncbi:hypothetical protein [Sulfitobacter sp. JB4-11]|uniref:hypothetical protein n=1 Tax=Sulfitobacter rhodophyticola TaxID=3238304 RepID=UPI0035115D08
MITRVLAYAGAVLIGWLAVLAGVMVLSDRAPAALVVMPDATFLANLPEDVAITSRTMASVTLIGSEGDFAARLYQAGARLVLPSGLRGCAPLATEDPLLPARRTVSAAGP